MEKYYVSGCKGLQGDVETCTDEQADFWTLYQRDGKGLSSALADFQSRKLAESVMAVYAERDALQRERDALAAEMSVVDAIHDKCVFITDDDYDACPESVQEIIRSLAVMQIPATDAFLNSVRAEGVDMVAEAIGSSARQLKVGSKDWMALKKVIFTLVGFSAKLRATAPKGDSDAE